MNISNTALLSGVAIILATFYSVKWFLRKKRVRALFKLAKEKIEKRDKKIAQTLPDPKEVPADIKNKILESNVVELIARLNKREITSRQIVLTYSERAGTIGKDLGLIAETLFDEAIEAADKCDKVRASTKDFSKLPPLFGIPISIKEEFRIKGLDCTFGLISQINKPMNEDSPIIRIIREAGGIPFVTTNIPQMLATIESVNHVYGRAKNPWNVARGTGGSSGGEGGMIAARCSVLGLGSDSGGSIRSPALSCGVYGFKGTSERTVKHCGSPVDQSTPLQPIIKYCYGPLGRSVNDLILFTQVLYHPDIRKYSPALPYVPLDINAINSYSKKKLKIAYFESEAFFPTCKANRRAVNEAVEALKKRGHTMIKLDSFPHFERLFLLTTALLTAEGSTANPHMEGEPLIDELALEETFSKIPSWLQKKIAAILNLIGEKRAAKIMKGTGKRTVVQFNEIVDEVIKTQSNIFKWWRELELDALLSPGMGQPAFKHGNANDLVINVAYLTVYNILNMPAGAVPITLVQEGEDDYSTCTPSRDMFDKSAIADLKGAVGMPVGIQVSTLPWEDELCLAVMREVESGIGFHKFPSI